jgi:hypothetical protein
MSKIIKILCIALSTVILIACFTGCAKQQEEVKPVGPLMYATYDEFLANSKHLHPEKDGYLRYALYDNFARIIECLAPQEAIVIPDTYQGKPVIAIDDRCFAGMTEIETVVFGANLLYVGSEAFANCTGLRQITMSNSINTIGARAFSGCTALTNAIIPPNVSVIPSGIFSGCTSLKKIIIESADRSTSTTESVSRVIEGNAFSDCSHLSIIWIPEDIVTVPNSIIGGSTPRPLVCGGDGSASAYFATQQRLDYEVIDRDEFDAHARLYDDIDLVARTPIGHTIKNGHFTIKLSDVVRYNKIGALDAGENYMFLAVTFDITQDTLISQYFDGLNVTCISNAPNKNGVVEPFTKLPILIHSNVLGTKYPVGPVDPEKTMKGTIVLKVSRRMESVSIQFGGTSEPFVI